MNCLLLLLSACLVGTHGYHLEYLPDPSLFGGELVWDIFEFNFTSEADRKHAEASGNLQLEKAIPFDVQPYHTENNLRIFMTIPRVEGGTPYTLGEVQYKVGIPSIFPYPNYASHNDGSGSNCDAITSAFRVAVTECNQMWVIDSGVVGSESKCPPQLLVFDLNTDTLIHRYRFDKSLYTEGVSLFVNLLVVVKEPKIGCLNTMVYVADFGHPGLVVYNLMSHKAWRVQDSFMYPEPEHALLTVAGESFNSTGGILSLVTDKKNLYFHPLASNAEYSVPLSVLDNATLFENGVENVHEHFKFLGSRDSPCTVSAIDSHNCIYCVSLNPIELLVWNVTHPYNSQNMFKFDLQPEILQYVSGIKVVRNAYGREQLWMMSNKLQKYFTGTRNFSEKNFEVSATDFYNIEL